MAETKTEETKIEEINFSKKDFNTANQLKTILDFSPPIRLVVKKGGMTGDFEVSKIEVIANAPNFKGHGKLIMSIVRKGETNREPYLIESGYGSTAYLPADFNGLVKKIKNMYLKRKPLEFKYLRPLPLSYTP